MTAGMPPRHQSNVSTITVDLGVEGEEEESQQEEGLSLSQQVQQPQDAAPVTDPETVADNPTTPTVDTMPVVVDITPSDVESVPHGGAVPVQPSQPISSTTNPPQQQQRDSSVTTSDNITLTSTSHSTSRESLRVELERRRNTLTVSELSFLEHLTMEGTNVEVELAMLTLADDELFFDYSTPRHLKYYNSNGENPFFGGDENENNTTGGVEREDASTNFSTERVNDDQDVATAVNPVAPTLSESFVDIMVETRGSMGGTVLTENDGSRDGEASSTLAGPGSSVRRPDAFAGFNTSRASSIGASSVNAVAAGQTNNRPGDRPAPPVPAHVPVMMDSQKKRMEVLERRRTMSGINLGKLWKAHETGLAVTAAGSKMAILRRSSTVGSAMSGISGITTGSQAPLAAQLDIFRQRGANESAATKAKQMSPKTPPRPRRQRHGRSKSITLGMIRSPALLGGRLNAGRPKVPEPRFFNRRLSTGSRKSVTFHQINEEFEFDGALNEEDDESSEEKKASLTSSLPPRSQMLRRANSDSIQYESPSQKLRKAQLAQLTEEEESSNSGENMAMDNSFSSLHHGRPIRQESVGSIPSIHHAGPIRQDSINSIPSLHHGHPVRQESAQSFPSLRHGHPLRGDSIASFPSLHHGQGVRSDSRQSIPSLHHGHPLQSTDDTSENLGGIRSQQFASSNDIASAWLQQKPGRMPDRTQSGASLGSLPHNVTVPLADTDTSYVHASTADDISVLSQTGPYDSPENKKQDVDTTTSRPGKGTTPRPILMRLASKNLYEGEGIEVTELDDAPYDQQPQRNISIFSVDASLMSVTSIDDMSIYSTSNRRTSDIFRTMRRSYSDDSMASIYFGSSRNILTKTQDFGNEPTETTYGDDFSEAEASWDMQSDCSGRFDAWNVLEDDYVNGYGGGDTLGFSILGTSASDESAQPHVLSPPLMESLQAFLPQTKSGQNFFLKYSMVRDGASLPAMLRRCRGIQHTIVAIETIDGEVFGSFTSQPWRKNWNYFGTAESFLWRMRRSRLETSKGILEQAQKESEIDVFPYTGANRFIQLCTPDRMAVGGGLPPSADGEKKSSDDINDHDWGFGLAIQSDMVRGTSSPCLTFASPSLSNAHSDGSPFEILNMELWTLTPCATVEDAEKLDLGKLFLQRDMNSAANYGY